MPTFDLGRLLATPGALEVLTESHQQPAEFLDRHLRGDWGEVCADDRQANEDALVHGARRTSVYRTRRCKILWLITEAADEQGHRCATTFLLLDEMNSHWLPPLRKKSRASIGLLCRLPAPVAPPQANWAPTCIPPWRFSTSNWACLTEKVSRCWPLCLMNCIWRGPRACARSNAQPTVVGQHISISGKACASREKWRPMKPVGAWQAARRGCTPSSAPRATCYVIDPTRSGAPAVELLGADWSGTLVHDGWSVYDRFTAAAHQQCLRHLQRRCQEMVETAAHGAERFPHAVLALIDQAFALRRLWRGHRLNSDQLAEHGLELSCELERLASGHFTNAPNRRLAKHLLKHAMEWFWFLIDPTIQATNHWAEQATRPAVVNRKVWGGNRTWPGAKAQSVVTSVIRTCSQRAVEPFGFLRTLLSRHHPQLIPP